MNRSTPVIAGTIAFLIVAVIAAYVLYSRSQSPASVQPSFHVATSSQSASPSSVTTTVPATTAPSSATQGTRVFRSVAGRWSASIPSTWQAVATADGWGTIRSYDPSQAVFERAPGAAECGPSVSRTEVRIEVQLVFSNARTGKDAADGHLSAPGPNECGVTLVGRRDDLTIAGQQATLLLENTASPPPAQVRRLYFLVAPGREQVVVIRAWPDDTVFSAELDAVVRSFTLE